MKPLHKSIYKLLGIIGVMAAITPLYAQQTTVDSALLDRISALEKEVADQKPGESHFMVVGLTTFGYVSNKTTFTAPGAAGQITKTNSLGDADHYELSPMLLWRHSNNLLTEFEPSFDGNTLGVNWANITYFAAPGLQIHAGYFVVPFGIYSKKLAAGWIDKLAGDPNGFDSPGTDFGIGVSGGLPLGDMKWGYDLSLTNGLQLLPDGELQNAGVVDNNKGKMISGRLSLLPFSNSCLEIGVSGLHSNAGDANSAFTSANVTMYGADLNFVKNMTPILVNVKGQYNRIEVSRQTYPGQNGAPDYTFSNNSSAAFAQISLRPTGVENKFLKNIEIAYRYSTNDTPTGSTWGAKSHQNDFGLDYWLTWRTVLKCTYSLSHSASTANSNQGGTLGITNVNAIYLQFSVEF